jgi:hypothetical protein
MVVVAIVLLQICQWHKEQTNNNEGGHITICYHVFKKIHKGKILLPYEDRLYIYFGMKEFKTKETLEVCFQVFES